MQLEPDPAARALAVLRAPVDAAGGLRRGQLGFGRCRGATSNDPRSVSPGFPSRLRATSRTWCVPDAKSRAGHAERVHTRRPTCRRRPRCRRRSSATFDDLREPEADDERRRGARPRGAGRGHGSRSSPVIIGGCGLVVLESCGRVLPDSVAGARGESLQQADHEVVVAEVGCDARASSATSGRCRSAGASSSRPGAACRRSVGSAFVVRELRVVAERDRALELRVEDDQVAAAVEPDPGARGQARGRARPGSHGTRGARGRRCPRARAPAPSPPAPSRTSTGALRRAEVEPVLPGDVRRPAAASARATSASTSACASSAVARGDQRVQPRRVRERVEREALAGEGAVEDAVVAGHVGAPSRAPGGGRGSRRSPGASCRARARAAPSATSAPPPARARVSRMPRAQRRHTARARRARG